MGLENIHIDYKINADIFGKLTKPELENLEHLLFSASHHAVMARNGDGEFIWGLEGTTELARLSGIAKSFKDFA